jgi:hypothetical protein
MYSQAVFPDDHHKRGNDGFGDREIHKEFLCKKTAPGIHTFRNSSGRNVHIEIPILLQIFST